MAKIIVVGSGLLAVVVFLAGLVLEHIHSPVKDFTQYLLLPVFAIVFLVSLFVVPANRFFKAIRVLALLGLLALGLAVFLPRSYGTLPMPALANSRSWRLPTGSRIAYTLIPGRGVKKPYPIIYLQGGPGGAMSEGLLNILTPFTADGYDVYVYDQIGSGRSGRLADIREYTTDRHRRDLEAIVRQIGAEKVILIGQSWGAILAALYVADNPGRVDRLILTGPGPIQPTDWSLATLKAPDSLHLREPYYTNHQGNELANNIRTRAMEFCASSFGWKLAGDAEADDFAAYLGSLVNRSTVCDTSLISQAIPHAGAGFYVQVMTVHSFARTPDPRPRLRGLPIPLLVLKGQCDNQKWGFTNEYLQLFPDHRLVVIPDAGHNIYGEQPDRYLTAIREFLLDKL